MTKSGCGNDRVCASAFEGAYFRPIVGVDLCTTWSSIRTRPIRRAHVDGCGASAIGGGTAPGLAGDLHEYRPRGGGGGHRESSAAPALCDQVCGHQRKNRSQRYHKNGDSKRYFAHGKH